MIESVRIQNFKSLLSVETRLERLTVLAGPNGCGKTSLLEGLNLLGKLRDDKPGDVFSGKFRPEVIRTHGVECAIELHAAVKLANENVQAIGCTVLEAPDSADRKGRWDYQIQPRVGFVFRRCYPSAQLTQLDLSEIAKPSAREEASDRLSNSGRGLPSLLADMKVTALERLETLLTSFRQVIPTVKNIDFQPIDIAETHKVYSDDEHFFERTQKRPGYQFRFVLTNGAVIPAHSMSEGTLLVLAILAAMYSTKGVDLMLIDNLDAGLHPRAGHGLVEQLRKIQTLRPELQIIATTHSPYLLDKCKPEEIRLMTSNENGHALIGSLSDHPEFDRWKAEMLPGEFWSMVGENWLNHRQAQNA